MIWHLMPLSQWRSAGRHRYVARPAGTGGFVHASPDAQAALAVANGLFAQCPEPLIALGVDEARLSAEVRYEPAHPVPPPGPAAHTLFPHVYGPVEASAVTEVRYARPDPSGRYVSLDVRPATAEALDLVPHPEGGWYRQTWAAGPVFQPAGTQGGGPPQPRSTTCCHRACSRAGIPSAPMSYGSGTPEGR